MCSAGNYKASGFSYLDSFINFELFIQKLVGELKSEGKFKLMDDIPQKIEEDPGIPTNLASFKLDLKVNEKKAKEELVLPYTLYVNYFLYN